MSIKITLSNLKTLKSKQIKNREKMAQENKVGAIRFVQEPPRFVRRTNYLSIKIQLWDETGFPVELSGTRLASYLGENGLCYDTTTKFADGQTKRSTIYLRLVDTANDALVSVNPSRKYGKVLLDHSYFCKRCEAGGECCGPFVMSTNPRCCGNGIIRIDIKINITSKKSRYANEHDQQYFRLTAGLEHNKYLGASSDIVVYNSHDVPLDKPPARRFPQAADDQKRPRLAPSTSATQLHPGSATPSTSTTQLYPGSATPSTTTTQLHPGSTTPPTSTTEQFPNPETPVTTAIQQYPSPEPELDAQFQYLRGLLPGASTTATRSQVLSLAIAEIEAGRANAINMAAQYQALQQAQDQMWQPTNNFNPFEFR